MPEIITKIITIFVAFRDGREQGIDLDRDALVHDFNIRDGSTRAHVRAAEEAVGVIEGELFAWWEEAGNPGGMKLHWVCPQCGLEQWGDWTSKEPNPCLWYSDCRCIGKRLIYWHGVVHNKMGIRPSRLSPHRLDNR